MSKQKKVVTMAEKVYESLEEWKNDFLPNAVKNEHLLFIEKVNNEKRSCDPMAISHARESASLLNS